MNVLQPQQVSFTQQSSNRPHPWWRHKVPFDSFFSRDIYIGTTHCPFSQATPTMHARTMQLVSSMLYLLTLYCSRRLICCDFNIHFLSLNASKYEEKKFPSSPAHLSRRGDSFSNRHWGFSLHLWPPQDCSTSIHKKQRNIDGAQRNPLGKRRSSSKCRIVYIDINVCSGGTYMQTFESVAW